jgi:hypothetical protein
MWRLFQTVIIVGVSAWIVSIAPPGEHAGMAPYLFGLFAAYIATLVLSKLIDLFRWLGKVTGPRPCRTASLHDQASSDRARLTAARLERNELIEQWPRPWIGQDRR